VAQNVVYGFGTFRLDPARRVLDSAGESIGIPPKALDALIYLIEHGDRVVKKEELVDALWPDVAVQDSSLTQLIFVLRKALDRNAEGREYIATASRYGYRFVAPVNVISADGVQANTAVPRSGTARLALALGIPLMLAFTLMAVFAYRERAPSDVHPIRMTIRPPENTLPSVVDDVESPPSISRDGRQIAFVARALDGRTLLWVRPLATLTARPLPGTEDAAPASVFWSPDGFSLAFVVPGHLKRVDVVAGTVQNIADGAYGWRGSWSAQGTILFMRTGGLYRVPANGGTAALVLSKSSDDEFFSDINFLPDGRHFVVLTRHETSSLNEVRVGALDSADTHVLLSGSDLSAAQYAPPFLLFMRGGRLQAQRLDLATLKLAGEPMSVAEQVSHNADGYGAMSVSDTGVLAYRTGSPPRTQLMWFDRTGRALGRVDTPEGHIFNYHLSSDGRQVAALIGPRAAEELWLLNDVGGPPRRLPFPAGHLGGAVWSHDGSAIAFMLDDGNADGQALIRQMVNLATAPDPLLRSPHLWGVTDWSSDGRFLIVQLEDAKFIQHIWAVPVSGDRHPVRLVDSGKLDTQGQLSPDGEWLAYRSRQTGRDEVYVKRFAGDAPSWKVSANGGNSPRWRGDGKELFYLQNDRSLMAVGMDPAGIELRARPPERLFDVHARLCGCFNFVPSPDGQRFLVNTFPNTGESQPLVVVLNWAADLEPARTDQNGRR
jgi:eukaryotic-like serine/threonine-protein kinase